MKKPIALLLTLALLLGCFALLPTKAQAANYSGTCGDNLTWEWKSNDLTISGTGPMYDYSAENPAPWSSISGPIFNLTIQDGVTSLGDYAFSSRAASTIVIPASVTSVGSKALANQRNSFCYFLGQPPAIAEDAFFESPHLIVRTVNWDDSVKLDYAGNVTWQEAEFSFLPDSSKQLMELNGVFQPEDFRFQLHITNTTHTQYIPFTPWQLSFSQQDHSSLGQKEITITANGKHFDFTYFVTDGTSHLDLIRVTFPPSGSVISSKPTVYLGSLELTSGVHYTHTRTVMTAEGYYKVVITGSGILEGYSQTFYCPILKIDLSNASVQTLDMTYTGSPVETRVSVVASTNLDRGTEFETLYQNNVNIGTGTVRVVGMNDYYGHVDKNFNITAQESILVLTGNYLGQADQELSDDLYIAEMYLSPGPLSAHVDYSGIHAAAYALYRVDEDDMTLIDEQSGMVGYWPDTEFLYDFSHIYEDAAETGGEIYALSYSWVTETGEVYGGALYLYVFSKVPDATAMMMTHVENDGDFRKEYLNVLGLDGAVGKLTWSSADSTIASVQDGILTLHKPGNVTITAQYKDLVCTADVTVNQLYLTDGYIFDYASETGTARVIYDGRILTAGTDYILSVEETAEGTLVTATGCGLFTGQLQKTFNGPDSLADPHTHTFDDCSDSTCNGCDHTRNWDHRFATDWSKDAVGHWYACTACGEQTDYAEHTKVSDTECAVCGTLYPRGDINLDMLVNRDDVIALLLHVSMADDFPIHAPADFTGDGTVSRDDVIRLLLHVSMPNDFPL